MSARVFDHPNLSHPLGWKCPFCNTDNDLPVVLVPIKAFDENNNARAEQVHLDCVVMVVSTLISDNLAWAGWGEQN